MYVTFAHIRIWSTFTLHVSLSIDGEAHPTAAVKRHTATSHTTLLLGFAESGWVAFALRMRQVGASMF